MRFNSPCDTFRARRCRVHRIPPRVRDDRDPPLVRGETAGFLVLIWVRREANCFFGRDWTGQIRLNWLMKLAFARNAISSEIAMPLRLPKAAATSCPTATVLRYQLRMPTVWQQHEAYRQFRRGEQRGRSEE